MAIELPAELAQFTIQDIQLELIRRVWRHDIEGDKIVALLLENRDCWQAAFQDQLIALPHHATPLVQYPVLNRLYYLQGHEWHADTFYVVANDETCQERLIALGVERELWHPLAVTRYDAAEAAAMLEKWDKRDYRVFSTWWD